ncbi:hypothetical protein BEWA_034180 [Theileria equi strain WA]|uniref:C2H2-type domain-containing protein n=1 Tax=Theileria equi strain WA TaxID=1537102 RepID=L0AZY2_THEEQ|nr:hypothetical protein BEWA_034180 [Theileria equi strain WA]AFZ80561.1 hypothetical protein BEWA_034180 [Theileria equi strain WA]|eukprot:XP_004830227.1 hypothetical protein BEWA_034180 [Theileria equi strain WA]
MICPGSAPLSSGIYFTKRRRLSESLLQSNHEKFDANAKFSIRERIYRNIEAEPSPEDLLFKDLVSLSLDGRRFEFFDACKDELDDDLNDGLRFLSQHLLLNEGDKNIDDELFDRNQPHYSHITSSMDKILDLLYPEGKSQDDPAPLDIIERDIGARDSCIGPLSVNEVSNLIALALKLQEAEKFDVDLEKRLEVSVQLWKKTNRIPNSVSPSLISALFESKAYQCSLCGIRFKTPDIRQRHMLTHEKVKSDTHWYSLDAWINIASKGVYGYSITARSPITHETFKKLFRAFSYMDDKNVTWLRDIIFPNEANLLEEDINVEVSAIGEETTDNVATGSKALDTFAGPNTLWSWGTMDDCTDYPKFEDNEDGYPAEAKVENEILDKILNNVESNIHNFDYKAIVAVSFDDMTKYFCAICQDGFKCEFDTKYNRFLYNNTTRIQYNPHLISQVFGNKFVPCDYILSMANIGKMNDPVEILKKMAVFQIVNCNIKSYRNLAITDWSFKYSNELLDIDRVSQRAEATNQEKEQRFKEWKNPLRPGGKDLPDSMIYTHTSCLKLVINAHLRYAKAKAEGVLEDAYKDRINKLSLL